MYPPQSPKSSSDTVESNVILICHVSLQDDVVVEAKFQSVVFVDEGYQIHAVMIYLQDIIGVQRRMVCHTFHNVLLFFPLHTLLSHQNLLQTNLLEYQLNPVFFFCEVELIVCDFDAQDIC